MMSDSLKVCWSCKVEQPIESFSKNRSKRSGRSAECKACVKAYNKRHVAENAEYYRAQRKAKRNANLGWYLYLECRTRAKRLGLEFNLSPEDIQIPEVCPVFGLPFKTGREYRDQSASVDRIDCSLGYVKGNIRVISYLANRMKSNATASQLEQFAQWILESSNGSEGRLDTGQSAAAHPNQHDRKEAGKSCAWQRGNDKDADNGSNGLIAQDITRSVLN